MRRMSCSSNAVIDGAGGCRRFAASRCVRFHSAAMSARLLPAASGYGVLQVISISNARIDLLQVERAGSGRVGIAVAADAAAWCAPLRVRCSTSPLRPQLAMPAHLRCEMTTGDSLERPMRKASSIASRMASVSVRMCVA